MGFFDSVKKYANDKFLQKVTCSCCQEEIKIMSTQKLADGNLVCNKCLNRIPEEFSFDTNYGTIKQLEKIINYMAYSKKELKPAFHSTLETTYGDISFDPKSGLFKVGYDSDLFFNLSDICFFNMKFVPKEYKEKMLSVKKCDIFGDVILELGVKESDLSPSAHYSTTVAYDEETTGVKKGLSGMNFIIDNPPEMEEFLARITQYINTQELLNGDEFGNE